MAELYLDTNVLLQHAEILAKSQPGDIYIILPGVMNELLRHIDNIPGGVQLLKLIQKANEAGTVRILGPDLSAPAGSRNVDAELLLHAQMATSQGKDVVVVSDDADLALLGPQRNMTVITSRGLLERVSASSTKVDEALLGQARILKRSQWIRLALNVALGVAGGIAGSFVPELIGPLARHANAAAIVLTIMASGIAAYAVRGRFKRIYGSAEVTFGTFLAIRVFVPGFDPQILTFGDWLQVLAGIYVIVRGLDNLSKGCERTRLEPVMRWLSGDNRK
jgi:hypothetical protein